jgi:hypothetical protein
MIPETERNKVVRELRKGGNTLQFIGDKFLITRERVRQLTKGIVPDKVKVVKRKLSEIPLIERLEGRCTEDGNCIVWGGSKTKTGYGTITYKHKKFYTHRAMWKAKYGAIPEGLDVLHKCDNPPCINPEHLFLGTQAINMLDRDLKGRHKCGGGKMTTEKIYSLRKKYNAGAKQIDLAKEYDLHPRTVHKIVNYQTWKTI